MGINLSELSAQHNRRWAIAKMNPDKVGLFAQVARRLAAPAAKKQYQEIEKDTGVPWFVIAVIHERESSQRWDRSIAQGDPWNKPSVHVPTGRGPFASFRAAAYDALVNCAPRAARWTDWSIGGALCLLEQYNGLGYANGPYSRLPDGSKVHYPPMPSPYVWGGTNIQAKGKYVRDGVFDINTMDGQLGVAGLLMAMQLIDNSILFGKADATAPVAKVSTAAKTVAVIPSPSIVPKEPSISSPAPGSLGDLIKKWFA